MSADEIRFILENYSSIAVVGLSRNPDKDSFKVADYLKSKGYRIIPINPLADMILGEKCYGSLLDVPKTIEVVDIFRPAGEVPVIVDQAIELKKKLAYPRIVWMQLGIVNEEAAQRAKKASLAVVMDRCMKAEHKRLSRTGAIA